MALRSEITGLVGAERRARLYALSDRLRVPVSQLLREAIDELLSKYEKIESVEEINALRLAARRALTARREEVRSRPRRIVPPKGKTIEEYLEEERSKQHGS